jgi:hypothetical protein
MDPGGGDREREEEKRGWEGRLGVKRQMTDPYLSTNNTDSAPELINFSTYLKF